MIDSIGASFPKRLQDLNMGLPVAPSKVETTGKTDATFSVTPSSAPTQSFGDVLTQAVSGVNDKMQTAEVEKAKVMSGETNNLHQAMLSIQEAGVAFSLMNEVRNKLVESYQEIMRMQV